LKIGFLKTGDLSPSHNGVMALCFLRKAHCFQRQSHGNARAVEAVLLRMQFNSD